MNRRFVNSPIIGIGRLLPAVVRFAHLLSGKIVGIAVLGQHSGIFRIREVGDQICFVIGVLCLYAVAICHGSAVARPNPMMNSGKRKGATGEPTAPCKKGLFTNYNPRVSTPPISNLWLLFVVFINNANGIYSYIIWICCIDCKFIYSNFVFLFTGY